MTAPMMAATPRTRPSATDRWLLVASVVVSVLAPLVWPALIGAVVLLTWTSVRLARRRPRSVPLLTSAIVALSLSVVVAVALGVATALTVSDTGSGNVTLIPG